MTYTSAGSLVICSHEIGNHQLNRQKHIITARALSRELRLAATKFEDADMSAVDPSRLWESMQAPAILRDRLGEFLEDLYFDGIRSRFFGDFDSEKLILPVATEIAHRLESLADDLERQLGPASSHEDRPSSST